MINARTAPAVSLRETRGTATRHADCPLCGRGQCPALFTSAGHRHIQDGRPFTYFDCRGCGVHFLEADELPGDLYFHEKALTTEEEGERRYVHWDDDVAARLRARAPGGRLLDFGSGYGDMLLAATKAGYEAEGVDVSEPFAAEARRRSGRPVFAGDIREAGFETGRFQAINAHFVLEYVRDLRGTFQELGRVLAAGGVLRVFGYTWDSLPARLQGSGWWNYTPTRLFLFSEKTMGYLAEAAGLRLAEVVTGGEQSARRYLEERPRGDTSGPGDLARTALDLARYHLTHAPLGALRPLSPSSARAFYFTKG